MIHSGARNAFSPNLHKTCIRNSVLQRERIKLFTCIQVGNDSQNVLPISFYSYDSHSKEGVQNPAKNISHVVSLQLEIHIYSMIKVG